MITSNINKHHIIDICNAADRLSFSFFDSYIEQPAEAIGSFPLDPPFYTGTAQGITFDGMQERNYDSYGPEFPNGIVHNGLTFVAPQQLSSAMVDTPGDILFSFRTPPYDSHVASANAECGLTLDGTGRPVTSISDEYLVRRAEPEPLMDDADMMCYVNNFDLNHSLSIQTTAPSVYGTGATSSKYILPFYCKELIL